jgi:hypothetical protein|nr:MAG TPA: LONG TAIL FIBER PROTEIN [Caudoviricetes sp.]
MELEQFSVMPTESDVVKKLDTVADSLGGIATQKTITLTGAVTGSVTTDLTGNITINTTTGSIDATKLTGTVPLESIPKDAQAKIVQVDSDDARLALTTDDVQNNDVVVVVDTDGSTSSVYWVSDASKLGTDDAANAFTPFPAGVAAAVDWSGVQNKPETFPPSAHTHTTLEVTAITDNADVHSLTTADNYSAASTVTGLTNAPCSVPFNLQVQRNSDGTMTQIVYGQADDGHGIYVSFYSGSAWSDWQTISYGEKGAYAKKSLENPYRQANTAYEVDDMVYSTILEAGKILKCITAGTTGGGDDVTASTTVAGTQITDGTVIWEVQLMAGAERVDGVKIGTISWQLSTTVDSGDLPLLGGTFDKETYAPLWNYVQTHPDMLVTETEWQQMAESQTSVLKYANTSDSLFRVPKLLDYARGAVQESVGEYEDDGLPNIEATATYATGVYYDGGTHTPQVSGAIKAVDETTAHINAQGGNAHRWFNIEFDASLSNPIYGNATEVRPKTMLGLYVVKAYSSTTEISDINIQTLLEKAGEGFAIGDIKFSFAKVVPNGWLRCDGNLYQRSEYPDLYQWATDNNYLVSEETWQATKTANDGGSVGYFSTGDGSTTFRVFNIVDFVRADTSASNTGTYQTDTMRNITGTTFVGTQVDHPYDTGCFTTAEDGTLQGATVGEYNGAISFDASLSVGAAHVSTEIQPKHLKLACLIKAKDAVVNRTLVSDVELKEAVDKIDELNGFILDDDDDWTMGLPNITNNAGIAEESLNNYKIMRTLSNPEHYYWYDSPYISDANNTTVIIPAGLEVNIGNYAFVTQSDSQVDISLAGSASARAGKDVYIYACWPSNVESGIPVFVASMNSTTPTGYNATNSRKIGGVHCLCADVGTIAGHPLSGYVAGDVLPASLWDLRHRPVSAPEGMVYIEPLDLWADIYLNSWDGEKVVSEYGAVIADGASSRSYHWWRWAEEFNLLKKRLPHRWEFRELADGSPEAVNITGSADPNTTGGHTATNSQRIISKYGCEDCTGVLWQWGSDLTTHGTTNGWAGSSYNSSIVPTESNRGGEYYATTYAALFGGLWVNGSSCGSRSVAWHGSVVPLSDYFSARGVAPGLIPAD